MKAAMLMCVFLVGCSIVVVQTRGNGDEPIHTVNEPPLSGCSKLFRPRLP